LKLMFWKICGKIIASPRGIDKDFLAQHGFLNKEDKYAMAISTIQEAIEDIQNGKMVILVDDEDRENEGDLCMAAEFISPETINFMARYGRGLICLTLNEEIADKLHLKQMVQGQSGAFRNGIYRFHRGATRRSTGISPRQGDNNSCRCNPLSKPDD